MKGEKIVNMADRKAAMDLLRQLYGRSIHDAEEDKPQLSAGEIRATIADQMVETPAPKQKEVAHNDRQ
jgi:hypothetical protein